MGFIFSYLLDLRTDAGNSRQQQLYLHLFFSSVRLLGDFRLASFCIGSSMVIFGTYPWFSFLFAVEVMLLHDTNCYSVFYPNLFPRCSPSLGSKLRNPAHSHALIYNNSIFVSRGYHNKSSVLYGCRDMSHVHRRWAPRGNYSTS